MKLSNNQVKYIRSLGQSKFRQKYENFVAEGDKCVIELLRSDFEIECIVGTNDWLDANEALLNQVSAPRWIAGAEQMQQISGLINPSDILIVAKQKWTNINELLSKQQPLFFLDGVQDPGNVGTIIRLSDWFGFGGIVCGFGTADIYHPKVVQASMGSITGIGAAKIERDAFLSLCNPSRIYVLDMNGNELSAASTVQDAIYVLGSEGKGVDPAWMQNLRPEQRITITGAASKIAESLNVGVAAGIVAHNHRMRLKFR